MLEIECHHLSFVKIIEVKKSTKGSYCIDMLAAFLCLYHLLKLPVCSTIDLCLNISDMNTDTFAFQERLLAKLNFTSANMSAQEMFTNLYSYPSDPQVWIVTALVILMTLFYLSLKLSIIALHPDIGLWFMQLLEVIGFRRLLRLPEPDELLHQSHIATIMRLAPSDIPADVIAHEYMTRRQGSTPPMKIPRFGSNDTKRDVWRAEHHLMLYKAIMLSDDELELEVERRCVGMLTAAQPPTELPAELPVQYVQPAAVQPVVQQQPVKPLPKSYGQSRFSPPRQIPFTDSLSKRAAPPLRAHPQVQDFGDAVWPMIDNRPRLRV